MSEKPNDINELSQRSRVLRALGVLPSIATPTIVDSGSGSDEGDAVEAEWPSEPPDDDGATGESDDATGDDEAFEQCVSCGCAVRSPGMCGPCVDNGGTPPPGFAFLQPIDEPLQETSLIVPGPPPLPAVPAAVDVLSRYLASCASKNSRIAMHQSLDRAARAMGGARAEDIPWPSLRFKHTDTMRSNLLQAVSDKRFRMGTVRLVLTAVRGVLREAVRMGVMRSDDFARATDWRKLPKHERLPAGRMLPPDEINAVWHYCVNIDGAYGAWLRAVFQLLLGTGLRATEACEIPVAGYDVGGKCIRFIRKGGKEDSQPLTEYQVELLNEWLVHRQRFAKRVATQALLLRVHQNDWVHPHAPLCNAKILAYIFRLVSAAAGVPHFSPHDLRRTFCSTGHDEGIDGSIMQRFMGHASYDTTQLYNRSGEKAKVKARAKFEVIPRIEPDKPYSQP